MWPVLRSGRTLALTFTLPAHLRRRSRLSAATTHDIELYNVLEPALLHPQPFLPKVPYEALTLSTLTVDGGLVAPPPELSRSLVFVGDSITAGFGSGLESAQVRRRQC